MAFFKVEAITKILVMVGGEPFPGVQSYLLRAKKIRHTLCAR